MSPETGFELDPRLAGGGAFLLDLPLSRIQLANDCRFWWTVVIPRRASVRDWTDLAPEDARRALDEAMQVGRALQQVPGGEDWPPVTKLNIAALGNMVPQLHIHVIGRHAGDAAWPGPVWGVGEAAPFVDFTAACDWLREAIREAEPV